MKNLIIGKREAVSNWLRQFVTIINIEERIYKIQESFLGVFKWGEYKPLPKIEYVLVFRSLFAKCEACSIEEFENNPNAYFQVSLVHNKNRRIILQETKNKNEAFDIAKNIASGLNTKIKDSASTLGKSVWLN